MTAALILAVAWLLLALGPASALADPAADAADGATPGATGTSTGPAPAADPAGTAQNPSLAPDSPPSNAAADPTPSPAPSTPPATGGDTTGADPTGAADPEGGSSKRSPSGRDDGGDRSPGDSAGTQNGASGTAAPAAAGTHDPTVAVPGAAGQTPAGPPMTFGATTTDHYDAWNIAGGADNGRPGSGGGPGSFARLLLGVAAPAVHGRDRDRRGGRVAKASPIGSGLHLPGAPGHGPDPFFSLFSGTGGASTSLLLAGLTGILAALFVLPPRGIRSLRTAAAAWRPSAYVPPIELPG